MKTEQPTPSPQEWFDQVNTPPPVPQTTPRRKRFRIIIVILIISLLIAGTVFILMPKKNTPSPTIAADCFEPKTYGRLLETINDNANESLILANVTSDEPLYVHEVYFQPDSIDFNLDIASNPIGLLEAIGTYYKANHNETPFTVHLETQYIGTDSSLANRRLEAVKKIMINAGVSEEAITIQRPVSDSSQDENPEEELEEEWSESDVDGIPVYVSILPPISKVCSE